MTFLCKEFTFVGLTKFVKTEIFYSSASSSKTKRDIGMSPTGEMMLTYRATNALLTKSGCGAVLTVFCLPKVGRCR